MFHSTSFMLKNKHSLVNSDGWWGIEKDAVEPFQVFLNNFRATVLRNIYTLSVAFNQYERICQLYGNLHKMIWFNASWSR